MDKRLICENLSVTEDGQLLLAGQKVSSLAKKYGTPLYLMDKDRIRERCRTYKAAAKKYFGENARVMYASKAASFKDIYRVMNEEDMYIDVVSCGEIATAKAAGFPLSKAYYHSAAKTDDEIAYAVENGIGCIVADSTDELIAINEYVKNNGNSSGVKSQPVMLRLTPGIDPHTFSEVATGKIDSKFGFGIATGLAEEALNTALALPCISLQGFHCHVGSQVFDSEVYIRSAALMLGFVKRARDVYGYRCIQLDLGGGYGVRYLPDHPAIDIEENIRQLGAFVDAKCKELGIDKPVIGLEPGRSIVADAGMTLYTAAAVKKIPDYINYVTVDGGMTDNVRYAMYKAPYTVVAPEMMNDEDMMKCTLAGRCCESGDIIQPDIELPKAIKRGDLVAVLTTGAYNYSMASNYNRIGRPALVMLDGGSSYIAVRRESADDILRLDE